MSSRRLVTLRDKGSSWPPAPPRPPPPSALLLQGLALALGAVNLKLEDGAGSPCAQCSAPLVNFSSLKTKTNHKPLVPLTSHS